MTLSLAAAGVAPVSNLVASEGGTNGVTLSGIFSAQPVTLDWQQFKNQSMPFEPQGAYIDNSLGTGPLQIQILSGNAALLWTITVPAGMVMHTPFPAPRGQTHIITGSGQQVTINYVDYPVMPFLYTP